MEGVHSVVVIVVGDIDEASVRHDTVFARMPKRVKREMRNLRSLLYWTGLRNGLPLQSFELGHYCYPQHLTMA